MTPNIVYKEKPLPLPRFTRLPGKEINS